MTKSIALPLALMFAALLAACSEDYKDPAFDSGGMIADQTGPDIRFSGMASFMAPEKPVRVFWSHGMCDRSVGWARSTNAVFATALGAVETTEPNPKIAGRAGAGTQLHQFRNHTTQGDVLVDYFVWSGLTKGPKQALEYDNLPADGGEFPYRRAALNAGIKRTLLNNCIADAFVYAGAGGARIKTAAIAQLCSFLGGNPVQNSTNKCHFRNHRTPENLFIVTSSLGSKVVYDAIAAIQSDQNTELNRRLADIRQFFMLSNQLPLLDLADQSPARADSSQTTLDAAITRVTDARAKTLRHGGQKLGIVAFTDPNDLLTYRLNAAQFDTTKTRITNVITTNAPVFRLIKPLEFANPGPAHCNYRVNPTVMALLVAGTEATAAYDWRKIRKNINIDVKSGCDLNQ